MFALGNWCLQLKIVVACLASMGFGKIYSSVPLITNDVFHLRSDVFLMKGDRNSSAG